MRLGMCSKGVALHGAQVPAALKTALFVNCGSPNLPITATPLARPFSFEVLHAASLTNYKCRWLLNCHAINSSS